MLTENNSQVDGKKKQGGRPTKSPEEKKASKIFINMTKSQKIQLENIAKKNDVSLSHLCLKALRDVGHIL